MLIHRFCMIAAILALLTSAVSAQTLPRERLSLDAGWRFQKDDPTGVGDQLSYANIKDWVMASGVDLQKNGTPTQRPAGNLGADISYTQPGYDDSYWRLLNLPHDWGIEGPFKQEYPGNTGKLPYWGVGWYRKHFLLPQSDSGRQIFLDIDGAMSYATVWLNGQFVGGWPYGYSSFRLDLTPYAKPGAQNVLAIRLDNPPNSSRWYPGGGIYRNVWLVKTSPVHVAHWGTYVTTPRVAQDTADVSLKVAVDNAQAGSADITAKTAIFALNAAGNRTGTAVASAAAETSSVPAGGQHEFAFALRVPHPKLWSLRTPSRYSAVTTIEQNGKLVDQDQTAFGIRTAVFDAQKGFLLNGEHIKIDGVCNHSDLGALGIAINTRALERQVQLLQEMGCNAIRTSHNPPSPELLDLCDRIGMLVMDESFDCWRSGKTPNDYHLVFDDWHERDQRAEVRRDRNHPSVIIWSIGNEVREQDSPAGLKIGADLASIVHDEDPTRPVTSACSNSKAGFNGFQNLVDVFGYNYKPTLYAKFHEQNPAKPLFGSETASCVSSRGEYFFPVSDDKSQGESNFQVSSYDLYAPRWATPPDEEFQGQDSNLFVAGEFVWTGFDYLGEPTPYNKDATNLLNFSDPAEQAKMAQELKDLGKIPVPSRSSYFGILDLSGFKKDRYYLYQAHWRPDLPMAHILPHWTWPDRTGQVTPVHVYTSGDEAELFLNGKSLGRKKKGPLEYRLRWDDVSYQPGELKVVAYKNGKTWAEDVQKTAGAAAVVQLKPDHAGIKADGQDLSFVTVTIADKQGLMTPRANNRLHFEISGPGEIVGVDNGDATDLESFQSSDRNAFNGLCLVIVRSINGRPGTIALKATSDGLTEAETTIKSVR